MTPHLARRASTPADSPSNSRSPKRRNSRAQPPNHQDNLYDLYAVCYHHGDDLETGHYTAACKNPYNNQWYKFDDSRITEIDGENAYSELVNNTAYMLFYKRKKQAVLHSCSVGNQMGHWALRMPKYVTKQSETLDEINEKDEIIDDAKMESIANEESDSETTAPVQTPSPSHSVASLPEDNPTELTSPIRVTTSVIHNAVVQTSLQRPLITQMNGVSNKFEDESDYENESSMSIEPYIHKDVHVNPKMTPVDTRRPRSVDYPSKPTSSATNKDTNRNYESSPLVTSINGVEYHPTTEDLVLSMFQETKYIVPRHTSHMNGDAHRPSKF